MAKYSDINKRSIRNKQIMPPKPGTYAAQGACQCQPLPQTGLQKLFELQAIEHNKNIDGKNVGAPPLPQTGLQKLFELQASEHNKKPARRTRIYIPGLTMSRRPTHPVNVNIDGKYVGQPPIATDVTAGKHKISITSKGFTPHHRTIHTPYEGYTTTLTDLRLR